MFEEVTQVIQIDKTSILVEPLASSHCGGCLSNPVCGHGRLTEFLLKKNARHLWLPLPSHLSNIHPGDQVLISIPQVGILWSTVLIYMLPLLLGFVGTLIGSSHFFANKGEISEIVGFLTGMFLGFLLVSMIIKRSQLSRYWMPTVVKKVIPIKAL